MRRRAKSTVLGALLGLLAIAALLGGCSKTLEPFQDAPRAATNTSPADVITMPDGFSNIAAKCDGPNRVYVVFHGDSAYGTVAVAPRRSALFKVAQRVARTSTRDFANPACCGNRFRLGAKHVVHAPPLSPLLLPCWEGQARRAWRGRAAAGGG